MKRDSVKKLSVALALLFAIIVIVSWQIINNHEDQKKENALPVILEDQILKFDVPESLVKIVQVENLVSLDEGFNLVSGKNDFFFPYGFINGPYSNENQFFTDMELPEEFEIAYHQQTYNTGIDWNGSSSVCMFELTVSKSNVALFSFGDSFSNKPVHTQLIEMEDLIISSSIAFADCIVIVTQNDIGKTYLQVFNPFLKSLGHSQLMGLEDVRSDSPFYLVPRDDSTFYIIYNKQEQFYCNTYQFKEMQVDCRGLVESSIKIEVQLIETRAFKENIKNVVVNNNVIGFEYLVKEGENEQITCFALLNRQLELLDVFQLPAGFSCSDLYIWRCIEGLKYGIAGEYLDKDSLYLFEPKSNIGGRSYLNDLDYGVLVDGEKSNLYQLLDYNYGGINYLKLDGESIQKTSNHSEVITTYLEDNVLVNQLNHFYEFDGNIIGFSGDEIVFTDMLNQEGVSFKSLIGRKVFQGDFSQGYGGGLVFLDTEQKAIGKIHPDGTTEILAEIPKELYEKLIDEGIYVQSAISELENGIGLNTQEMVYYYSKEKNVWKEYSLKGYNYYMGELNTYVNENGASYQFDPIDETFKMEYPFFSTLFTSLEWKGDVYVNVDETYPHLEVLVENPPLIPVSAEYVSLGSMDGQDDLRIIDSRQVDERKFVQLYEEHTIVEIKDENILPIIDMAVRIFDVNKKGILYTGYGDQANTYFFSFETGEQYLLYDQAYCDELCLLGTTAFIVTNQMELRRFDLDAYSASQPAHTNELVEHYDIAQLFDADYTFSADRFYQLDANDEYLIISAGLDSLIAIIDPESLETVDKFQGSEPYTYQSKLIYRLGGLLVLYDFQSQTMEVLTYAPFPIVISVMADEVIYRQIYDDAIFYKAIHLNENFIDQTFKEEKDYNLMIFQEVYFSFLILYDIELKRLTLLEDALFMEYEVLPSMIRYRAVYDWDQEYSEWIEYPMPDGYSIEIYTN